MKYALTFSLLMLVLILMGPVLMINAQVVKEDDLIIYYSFNKDTLKGDDVVDVSGNKNDGLIKGNDIKSVKGKVGEGMEFPGVSSDYISVREHQYADPIEEISLAAWVKTGQRGMIASWDRSEFFRFAVGDDVGGNNGTTFVAFDTCCPCCHDWFGKTDVADDKWHHLVATSDGKEHRIYVDGKLDEKVDAPAKVIGAGLRGSDSSGLAQKQVRLMRLRDRHGRMVEFWTSLCCSTVHSLRKRSHTLPTDLRIRLRLIPTAN